jgi:hypothetical protein
MPKKPKDDDDLLGLTRLANRLDKADDDEPQADDKRISEDRAEPDSPSEEPENA